MATTPRKPAKPRATRRTAAPTDTPPVAPSTGEAPKTEESKPARTATRTRKPVAAAAAEPSLPAKAPVAAKRSPAPKPRSTKRTAPAPRKSAVKTPPAAPSAADRVGGKWGVAAIAGGLAAAAGAALLTLRGSTPKSPKPKPGHAHQADGGDSSKSFDAGIADEGSVPEQG